MMNTDNLGVNGTGVGVTNDHYGHHHLAHPHLLPPHHVQHPPSIYCGPTNPYSESFPQFQTDFVASHESANNNGMSSEYLNLASSIDLMVSHNQHSHQHHHHHHPHHAVSSLSHAQQAHQQHHHIHHHQMTSSSNNDRTSSSTTGGLSNASPSHSFPNTNNYSSLTEYYSPSVLASKNQLNTSNLSGTSSNNNNNNNNNTNNKSSSSANNTTTHSPYDNASTATTSSPTQSASYHSSSVKQETILPGSFPIDAHSNYGNINGHTSGSTGNSSNSTNPNSFGLNMEEYGSSLYHSPSGNAYSSYPTTGLLQATYSVGPYGVTHPDHMRLYSSQLKHDFGIDMRIKLLGNQRSSPNADVSPSQLCAVCQDSAQCQHYGVRTCEGCKGFFKRTVQKNAKYVCLADKNCPVDKRRRNRCQYCRFQTCLAVGMDKEVVRTDTLKGRRGRLPSKPKSPNLRQPNSFQTQFCRFFNDSTPNPASLDYSKLNYRTVTNKENLCEEKLVVYDALTRSCDVIKQWADKFCLFYSIQNNERDRLYSNSLLEQIVFRTAIRVDGDRIIFCSGVVVHKVQFNYLLNDVAQQLFNFSSALKAFKIDPIISATLASILLLDSNNPDYVYHRTPLSSTVTELHQKMIDSLKDYLKQQQDDGTVYLQLLERLNDVRQIANHLRKRLSHYRQSTGLNNSMNSLLDFVLECKPISSELQTNDENPSLSFMHYDL